jgi:hypothetical protein
MFRQILAGFVLLSILLGTLPVNADVLKGRVEQEDLRLRSNDTAVGRDLGGPKVAPPMRLARPQGTLQGSAVDTTAFAPLLPGKAVQEQEEVLKGVANDFAQAPKNFDIGAERGSREMVLAWERWHKQLSEAIYTRWQKRVRTPGKATIRVEVTRDRQIRAFILNTDSDGPFISSVTDAIEGLNGNPGLTFPAKSQRRDVSFEADYVAATNVNPGYSWVKNDYERVRNEY